ncbi:hypothetical protein [Terrabacter sp. NPDC080008]|uniref:hypothetical protein n=1 Tax=Terrabacter sp. NPDC080008 TaxID=3155176 RepID=UPI00344F1436
MTPSVQPPTTSAPQSGSGPAGASGATGASSPTGRYGPLVSVTRFEVAPPELEWQLPLNGELYRLMPGSDRPDYSLFVLERPLHFYPAADFDLGRVEAQQRVQDRKGRTMVRVHAMLLCARFVGQQLHPGMKDLAVNLAYVIDNSLARDPEVDFSKIQFAAIGFLSEGHTTRPEGEPVLGTGSEQGGVHEGEQSARPDGAPPAEAAPTAGEPTADPAGRHTSSDVSDVLDELARTLREGVEAERGARVERLTAVLTVGPDHRLTGLSGNADGQAPIPTADTFDRLGEILARLSALGQEGRVATVTVRAEGQVVTREVTAAHD